jgi:hypothetical protein
MVTFGAKSFTIEVPTGGNSVEYWLNLHDDLCQLLQNESEDMLSKHYDVHSLLESMTPEWRVAKAMCHRVEEE